MMSNPAFASPACHPTSFAGGLCNACLVRMLAPVVERGAVPRVGEADAVDVWCQGAHQGDAQRADQRVPG